MQPKGQKRKLEDLPESGSKFWEGAEVHTNIIPHTELSESGHYFERVAGNEAQCKNCSWGFVLDAGDKIEDGHLYTKDGEFVI
jgi:hypothetical protein